MIRLVPTMILAGAALLACPAAHSPAVAADVVDVGKQYKCTVCHVDRLGEIRKPAGPVFVDRTSIGMERYGPQDPASTQRMCLSCHDGFVLDSRFVWSGAHATHPVGVAPAAGMDSVMSGAKTALPLNDEGEVYCGTCHVGHVGKGAAASAPTFVRAGRADGQICVNCHRAQAAVAGSPHARVKKNGQPPDYASRGICGRCHAPHDNRGPLLWAKAPRDGVNTPANGLCRTCHGKKPDPGEHPAAVLAWSQSVREHLTGKSATALPVFDGEARPADRGAIACPTCHDVHRQRAAGLPADRDGLFLRLVDTDGFLCADCHGSRALFLYQYFHATSSRR